MFHVVHQLLNAFFAIQAASHSKTRKVPALSSISDFMDWNIVAAENLLQKFTILSQLLIPRTKFYRFSISLPNYVPAKAAMIYYLVLRYFKDSPYDISSNTTPYSLRVCFF